MEVSEKTLGSIIGSVLGVLGIGKFIGDRFDSFGKKRVAASKDVDTRRKQIRLAKRVRRTENNIRDIKGTLAVMAEQMKNLNENFGRGKQ